MKKLRTKQIGRNQILINIASIIQYRSQFQYKNNSQLFQNLRSIETSLFVIHESQLFVTNYFEYTKNMIIKLPYQIKQSNERIFKKKQEYSTTNQVVLTINNFIKYNLKFKALFKQEQSFERSKLLLCYTHKLYCCCISPKAKTKLMKSIRCKPKNNKFQKLLQKIAKIKIINGHQTKCELFCIKNSDLVRKIFQKLKQKFFEKNKAKRILQQIIKYNQFLQEDMSFCQLAIILPFKCIQLYIFSKFITKQDIEPPKYHFKSFIKKLKNEQRPKIQYFNVFTIQDQSQQIYIPQQFLISKSTICNEAGLFNAKFIKQGTKVMQYIGQLKPGKRFYNERAKLGYFFENQKQQIIDASFYGNQSRFLNHSDRDFANIKFSIREPKKQEKILLIANRCIFQEEQLFVDYGKYYNVEWKLEFEERNKSKNYFM